MAEMSRCMQIRLEQQASQCMLCYDAPVQLSAMQVQIRLQWCGAFVLKIYPEQRNP